MIEAIKEGYGRYFDFSGRTGRKRFWLWVLFVFLTAFVLGMIDRLVWAPSIADRVGGIDYAGQPLAFLFALFSFVPIARGAMTRTWLSMPGIDLFACAGIWRDSDEWGRCYSMVMTDAAGPAAEVHSRMPVLLAPDDYDVWTGGSPDEAKALCKAWPGSLEIDQRSQPWSGRG